MEFEKFTKDNQVFYREIGEVKIWIEGEAEERIKTIDLELQRLNAEKKELQNKAIKMEGLK